MQKLFSTQALHPRDRFDFWHEFACKNIVGHDSHPQSRRSFHAEFERGSLAEISILSLQTSPMEFFGTKRHVARAETDELLFNRPIEGTISFEKNGREVVLEAGDMTLIDPLLPYTGRFGIGSKLLVIKIPRPLLEERAGKLQAMTAVAMKPDDAELGLTSAFLAALPAYTGQLGSSAHQIVKEQTLDLIALSLATTGDRIPRLSTGNALILLNIRASVEARLSDPKLDVKSIADAAGVSVRYANALLALENTSLSRLIQTRRLMRCQKALEDPSQSRRTVSEIAYSWGFSDMTHFGRIFKKAYGMLPSEYRTRAKQQGQR